MQHVSMLLAVENGAVCVSMSHYRLGSWYTHSHWTPGYLMTVSQSVCVCGVHVCVCVCACMRVCMCTSLLVWVPVCVSLSVSVNMTCVHWEQKWRTSSTSSTSVLSLVLSTVCCVFISVWLWYLPIGESHRHKHCRNLPGQLSLLKRKRYRHPCCSIHFLQHSRWLSVRSNWEGATIHKKGKEC